MSFNVLSSMTIAAVALVSWLTIKISMTLQFARGGPERYVLPYAINYESNRDKICPRRPFKQGFGFVTSGFYYIHV